MGKAKYSTKDREQFTEKYSYFRAQGLSHDVAMARTQSHLAQRGWSQDKLGIALPSASAVTEADEYQRGLESRGQITGAYDDITAPQGGIYKPIYDRLSEDAYFDEKVGQRSVADPESLAAMQRALDQMEGVAQDRGFSPGDRARQQLVRADIDRNTRGARETALAGLQSRGLGGSGTELASLLGTSQAGTQAKAMADARLTADAGQRALDAMGQSYDMAGGIASGNQAIADANAEIMRQTHVANQQIRQELQLGKTDEDRHAQEYNLEQPYKDYDANLSLAGARSGAAATAAGLAQGGQSSAIQQGQFGASRADAKVESARDARIREQDARMQRIANFGNLALGVAREARSSGLFGRS